MGIAINYFSVVGKQSVRYNGISKLGGNGGPTVAAIIWFCLLIGTEVKGEADMNRKLRKSAVAKRYDDVNPRTIDRWTQDPKLNFPKPFFVGRTPFWSEDALEEWERARARPGRPVTADT
jgi:hypothetical protein